MPSKSFLLFKQSKRPSVKPNQLALKEPFARPSKTLSVQLGEMPAMGLFTRFSMTSLTKPRRLPLTSKNPSKKTNKVPSNRSIKKPYTRLCKMPLKKPSKIPSEKPSAKPNNKPSSKYDLQTVYDSQQAAIKEATSKKPSSEHIKFLKKKISGCHLKSLIPSLARNHLLSFSIFLKNTINMPLQVPYSKPIKKPSNKNCLASKKKLT
jgi:hypothetical protein